MTATAELIDAYLDRLDKAAGGLPASRRVELLTEIKEHITVALAESPDQSEATVRTVLDRLGDPEDIAREAGAQPKKAGVRDERLAGTRARSVLAITVVLTAANFVFPLVGWAVGAVLAWALTRWPTRHKLLATVIWPLGFGVGGWFLGPGASESSTCAPDGTCQGDGLPPIEVQMGLGLIAVLLSLVATIVVIHRDNRAQAA